LSLPPAPAPPREVLLSPKPERSAGRLGMWLARCDTRASQEPLAEVGPAEPGCCCWWCCGLP